MLVSACGFLSAGGGTAALHVIGIPRLPALHPLHNVRPADHPPPPRTPLLPLRHNCGIISLPQVRYSESHPNVLSAAAKLGGGKAQPALELVGYEAQVEAAIKYAFGSAFVCQVGRLQYSTVQCRKQCGTVFVKTC
jgi:hypothetical protein